MVGFSFVFHSPAVLWKGITIRTEIVTNENLGMFVCFRSRNGKAGVVPQIFFRICFHNEHVGHAEATAAGETYETNQNPRDFLSFS